MSNLKNYLAILFCLCAAILNAAGSVMEEYEFTFRSSVVYGSQTNDLTMYVSTDFNGGHTMADINGSKWTDITTRPTLAEGSPFVSSGDVDFASFIEPGKPLFIAFKYSAPATSKPTQRMWRIQSIEFKHNGAPINLSDWLFINHEDNGEHVGWEDNTKGIQYRSRMTKKKTESWAVIQILIPNTKPIITGGTASAATPTQPANAAPTDKNRSNDNATAAVVTQEDLRKVIYDSYLKHGPDPRIMQQLGGAEVLEKTQQDGYERWHVKYKVDTDEYSYAYILVPLNIPTGAKLPLLLCPHPTYILGKNRAVHLYDEPIQDRTDSLKRSSGQYALDLVQKGFVVFAPDRAGYGERRLLPNEGFKENMSAFSGKLREKYPKFGLNGKVELLPLFGGIFNNK